MIASTEWIDFAERVGTPTVLLLLLAAGGWRGLRPILTRLVDSHVNTNEALVENHKELTEVSTKMSVQLESIHDRLARIEDTLRRTG